MNACRTRRHAVGYGAHLIGPFCLAFLTSCGATNRPLFEAHGPIEVGATQFSVTSVTPWAQIERDLQPNFQIDENSALQQVLPSTGYSTQQTTDSFQLGVTAGDSVLSGAERFTGKPKNSSSGNSTSNRQSTSNRRSTNTRRSGTTEDDTEGTDNGYSSSSRTSKSRSSSPGANGDAASSRNSPTAVQTQAVSGTIGTEPQLKYALATSLLQYVRLTNHYVQDVVDHDGSDAYVVRVQISLMPLKRTAQYDTYVDVSFFDELTAQAAADSHEPPASITVVPLLSTDSLEGVIESRSSSDLKEFALSLQTMVNGAGGGVNADKLSQILKQVSGREMNSLLTMGQVNPNTIRIRLGAEAEPTGEFVMVPRTYSVPVVLLVKHEPTQRRTLVRAISKTVFINSITGQLLAGRTSLEGVIQRPEIAKTYTLLLLGLAEPDLMALTEYAVLGDTATFTRKIHEKQPLATTAQVGRYWVEALSLRATDAVQKLTFPLPRTETPQLPPLDQTGWLFDDGTKTIVALSGGRAVDRLTLTGILEIAAPERKPIRFFALDQPVISDDGRAVEFHFPSLAAAGISLPIGAIPADKVALRVRSDSAASNDSPASSSEAAWSLVHLSAIPDTPPAPILAIGVVAPPAQTPPADQMIDVVESTVQADAKQSGQVTLIFTAPPNYAANYQLSIDGATIGSIDPADDILRDDNGKWTFQRSGRVTLHLIQCTPPSLKFHLIDEAGHPHDLIRPLIDAPNRGSEGGNNRDRESTNGKHLGPTH
jgi:hypothetical protein